MTKLPVTQRLSGRRLGVALLWEGVVYGTTEGVLLPALPVLMAWQTIHSLGWSGTGGAIARWTLPVAASIVIIIVHHLGYWEYRNPLLLPISVGCGLMSLGYLVTASPIAPTLAHVLSHATSLIHGAELPPHPHRAPVASAEPVTPPGGIRGGLACGVPRLDRPLARRRSITERGKEVRDPGHQAVPPPDRRQPHPGLRDLQPGRRRGPAARPAHRRARLTVRAGPAPAGPLGGRVILAAPPELRRPRQLSSRRARTSLLSPASISRAQNRVIGMRSLQ